MTGTINDTSVSQVGKRKEKFPDKKILDCFQSRYEYKVTVNIREKTREKSSYITRRIETQR